MHTRQEQLQAVDRLLTIINELRERCPWDRKQTNQSLRPNTIEEVYELSEALSNDDQAAICEELGDVLMHICFYALFGSERETFDLADVCNHISDKLIFRHPHIYGDVQATTAAQVESNWEQIKQRERKNNGGESAPRSALSGVPEALPSLIKAYRIQDKARGVGFDWPDRREAWGKVKEEIAEFQETLGNETSPERAEEEMGDLFFSLVNVARLYNINPDNALERTNRKFIRRFNHIERRAAELGRDLRDMTLAEMDALWDESKRLERGNDSRS